MKGQATILALQDYIFTLETNLNSVNGAKKALTALTKVESQFDSLAASGYAAVFSEQYNP